MAGKTPCPKCKASNYPNDAVCVSCGHPLRSPAAPAPSAPEQASSSNHTAEPTASAASPIGFLLKALGVSVLVAVVEFGLIAALKADHTGPAAVYFIPMPASMVGVIVGGLLWGVLRAALIGGLLLFTKWSPTVGLLIGGAMGYALIGPAGAWQTVVGGVVVGFAIGIMRERLD